MERFAGRYALLRRLGRGGMGDVYLARDLTTDSECALKRITAGAPDVAPELLRSEFEALTRIRHPAIVRVFELGLTPAGSPFITMEYVPGLSANRAVPRGDLAALVFVAARVAGGLEALHAADIVHGDLKPSNLLVLPGRRKGDLPAGVRLVDFGLAALLGRGAEGRRGTPGYAAPEVARGESAGVAGDLYGLGATLYELVSGRAPFAGEKPTAILRRQQTSAPPSLPLEEAGCPPALIQLVLRMMAIEPAERPSDAREVRLELERIHPAAKRTLGERLETSVVVGRERELARLERRLAEASKRTRVVVLTGEAGSGKSTLLGELAVRATLSGRRIARSSSAALHGSGGSALALIRGVAAAAGADIASSDDAAPARDLLLDLDAAAGEGDIDALVEAGVKWMDATAEQASAPLMLLDDTERMDALSRSIVRRMMLHPRGPAALWVLARRGEPGALLEDERVLAEAGLAESIALGGLDREGVARLAAARLAEAAPDELVEALWGLGGGHPGLTVALLRAAGEQGALAETEAGLTLDREKLGALRPPATFEDSLLARLHALAEPARRTALALAVWARPVTLDQLKAAEPAAGDAALAALEGAGLAAREDSGRIRLMPPALADRIRESAHEDDTARIHLAVLEIPGLPPAERFEHFRSVGAVNDALTEATRAFAASPDVGLAIAAAALAEETSAPAAAMWFERAGRELGERGRYKDAIPHLERALALEPQGDARFERWLLLARAYLRAASHVEAGRVIRACLDAGPNARVRAMMLAFESSRLHATGEIERSQDVASEALEHAKSSGDDYAIASAYLNLSAGHVFQNAYDVAEGAAKKAIEHFEKAGDLAGQAAAQGNLALIAKARGRRDEAVALFEKAIELSRHGRNRMATQLQMMGKGTAFTELGLWRDARDAHSEALRISLEDGLSRATAMSLGNISQAEGLLGRARTSRRQAKAAYRMAKAYAPTWQVPALRSLAQSFRITGDYSRATRVIRKMLGRLTRTSGMGPGALDWARIELAQLLILQRAWNEADDLLGPAIEGVKDQGSIAHIVLLSLGGRVALNKGDRARARDLMNQADELLAASPAPYAGALARILRAELHFREQRADEGVQAAEAALGALKNLPAPWERAQAALDLARAATGSLNDPPDVVSAWLEIASTGFERLGNHRERERALGLQVEWLRKSGRGAAATGDERGLVERVAWLLQSLSDPKELADRAMQMAIGQLNAERGVLLVIDSESQRLVTMAEHGELDADTRRDALGYSRKVVQKVTESGVGLVYGDAATDPGLHSESVVDMNLRSIVCVPMHLGGRVIGAVYLDDSRRPEAFGDADRSMLEGFAQLMAIAIDRSRGHAETLETNARLVGENLSLREQAGARYQVPNLTASSAAMSRVVALVETAAHVDATVLLTGEMGTGKEFVARALHHVGKRAAHPFVAVNCGAIPENLIETELFGILANVATDVRARPGRFLEANGGTLFLDEIGEMPLNQQVTLLSVLSNREITPVGGGKPIPVDVRVVAASNQDLRERIEAGLFREDLFYRLNVMPIEIPPLRERKADIPILAHRFLREFAQAQNRKPVPEMPAEFTAALMQSDWKGNVRELQNYMEKILAMTPGDILLPDPPPRDLEERAGTVKLRVGRGLIDMVEELERKMIREALGRANGNQSGAARELGLTEQSLRYRIKKYGLESVRDKRRGRGSSRVSA